MRYIDPLGTDTMHVNPDGTAQRYPDGTIVSLPGGEEDVFIQDQELPEVIYTYEPPVKSPSDMFAIQITVVAATPLG